MKHSREFGHFIDFLEIEEVTGQVPLIILESIGHYYFPVDKYCDIKGAEKMIIRLIVKFFQ